MTFKQSIQGLTEAISRFNANLFANKTSAADQGDRLPHQLATYLPYRAYDEVSSTFVLSDGLGFVFEVSPQTGAGAQDEAQLSSIFKDWPTDTRIQIQLLGSPQIQSMLQRFARLRPLDTDAQVKQIQYGRPARNSNTSRVAARNRYAYLARATTTSITTGNPWLIRNFRLFISVAITCDAASQEALLGLCEKREGMASTLAAAGYLTMKWGASDLIAMGRDLATPEELFRTNEGSDFDPLRSLRDQVVDFDARSTETSQSILFERNTAVDVRTMAVRRYPTIFTLSKMAALLGSTTQPALQYPCPFLITMGCITRSQAETEAWVSANQMRAVQNAGSNLAKYDVALGERREDWDAARAASSSGDSFVSLYHSLLLFCTPDTANQAQRIATAIWKDVGLQIGASDYFQRPLYLASFPLGLTKALAQDLATLRVASTKTTSNAIALSPMLAEWQGTRTPVMLFVGRKGQLCPFDPYDSTENYHIAAAGTSGSGKSYLLAEIADTQLAVGAKVWIIDLGRSFARLCTNRGGEHLVFSSQCGLNINPFSYVVDFKDDFETLRAIVAKMASPGRVLDDSYLLQCLGDAITSCWNKYEKSTTVGHIAQLLSTGSTSFTSSSPTDHRLVDLSKMLSPYHGSGAHASYFDGPANVTFDSDLTVIECEELKRSPHLHQVVVMVLMFQISAVMFADRARRKILMIDELAQQLGGSDDKYIAELIASSARRIRKQNGSLVTATQLVSDYFVNPALSVAFTLASHRFILKQNPDAIAAIEKGDFLKLSAFDKLLLNGIHTVPGKYSEFLLFADRNKALLRLTIDPYADLLYSTRPSDTSLIDRKVASGKSVDEAIQEILLERSVL